MQRQRGRAGTWWDGVGAGNVGEGVGAGTPLGGWARRALPQLD